MQNLLPLGSLPVILQQAFLKITDNIVCNAPHALSGLATDTMLCAGFMSGEVDACQILLDTLSNHFFRSTNSMEVFITIIFFVLMIFTE